MRQILDNIFITAFVFIYFYRPKLLGSYNPVHVLAAFSILYILTTGSAEMLRIIANRTVKIYIVCFTFLIGYVTVLQMVTFGEYQFVYTYALFLFHLIPCSMFLSIYLKKRNYDLDDVLALCVRVGCIQSLFVVLMFIYPGFRDFIMGILIKNGFDFEGNQLAFWSQFRIYGIATGYMFSFPVLQGLIGSFAVYLFFRGRKHYLVYIPLIMFSILVNARTGMFILIACSLVVVYFRVKFLNDWKAIVKILFITLGLIGSFFGILSVVGRYSEYTKNWIEAGVTETAGAVGGESGSSTYEVLIREAMEMPIPYGIGILFGTGSQVSRGISANASITDYSCDTGYINDLMFGGIIFTAILYLGIAWLPFGNKGLGFAKCIPWVLISAVMIANLKGVAILVNEFMTAYVFISMTLIYNYKKQPGAYIKDLRNFRKQGTNIS